MFASETHHTIEGEWRKSLSKYHPVNSSIADFDPAVYLCFVCMNVHSSLVNMREEAITTLEHASTNTCAQEPGVYL